MRLISISLLAILGSILVLGCGATHLEDLKQPALWWEQRLGMCSRLVAVDANRTVWNDQGCENDRISLDNVGVTTQDRYSAVKTASTLLPNPPDPMPSCSTGGMHVFGIRNAGSHDSWFVCGSGAEYGGLDGLDEPFLSLAMDFQELP